MIQVLIIIPNWKNSTSTINCIKSLNKLKFKQFKVIICNNNSKDDSFIEISNFLNSNQKYDKDKFLIENTGFNGGYAFACNHGIRYGLQKNNFEYFWILNNDTEVEENSLTEFINYMEKIPSIGLCGNPLLYLSDYKTIQGLAGKYNKWTGTTKHIYQNTPYNLNQVKSIKENNIDYIIGASMFIKKSTILKVGLLDENYFLYCEEHDYCIRVKRKGIKIGICPTSIVFHEEGGTSSNIKINNEGLDFIDKFYLKNHLTLSRKFFPFIHPIVRFFYIFKVIKRLIRGNFKMAKFALKCMIFYY